MHEASPAGGAALPTPCGGTGAGLGCTGRVLSFDPQELSRVSVILIPSLHLGELRLREANKPAQVTQLPGRESPAVLCGVIRRAWFSSFPSTAKPTVCFSTEPNRLWNIHCQTSRECGTYTTFGIDQKVACQTRFSSMAGVYTLQSAKP